MRHLDHELLGVLPSKSRRKSVRGVNVERILNPFQRAKDGDDVRSLVAHIGRFCMFEERVTQLLENAPCWNERRKSDDFGGAARCGPSDSVGEGADC